MVLFRAGLTKEITETDEGGGNSWRGHGFTDAGSSSRKSSNTKSSGSCSNNSSNSSSRKCNILKRGSSRECKISNSRGDGSWCMLAPQRFVQDWM
eukprot:366259-Chlamydomonas_euryale.AAC.12